MIVTRTPFRVSFVGGGTDQLKFYSQESGSVISATVDKYIYVTVAPRFDGRVHVRYSQIEEVDRVEDLHHTLVRECLKLVGLKKGVEIVTISDIPARGSGLGSSSSLVVGLLNALFAFKGVHSTPDQLAEMACHVEVDLLKAPIGKQDQYAAAFGGLNKFQFESDGSVSRQDLLAVGDFERLKWLENSVMLFYTGEQRSGNEILRAFVEDLDKNFSILKKQRTLVPLFMEWVMDGMQYEEIGAIVDTSWELKKQASSVANSSSVEQVCRLAKEGGSVGVKVCGAGGGGFVLALVPHGKQDGVRNNLLDFKELPVRFSSGGSKVVYKEG